MERRAYPRHALQLQARVSVAGISGQPCWIRDFCLGGMYIGFGDKLRDDLFRLSRPLEQGDRVEIEFSAAGQDRPHRLTAKVVRATENGMGVSFDAPDPGAVVALQRLAANQPAGAASQDAEPATPKPTKLTTPEGLRAVEVCREILKSNIPARLTAFFRDAGDGMVAAAGKSANNVIQSQYFDALTAFNRYKKAIEQELASTIIEQVTYLGSYRVDARRERSAKEAPGLSLIDKEAFEDFLAISEMISRAENRFERGLEELQHRFSRVLQRPVRLSENPVGPAAVCYALDDALGGLTVHPSAMQVIYKSFEYGVVNSLGALYKAMNQALEKRGIRPLEPAPPPVIRPRRPPPAPTSPVAPEGAGAEQAGSPAWPAGSVAAMPAYPAGAAAPGIVSPAPVSAAPGAVPAASGQEASPPPVAAPAVSAPAPAPPVSPAQGSYQAAPANAAQGQELMQAAYMTAQTLLALQRQVSPGAAHAPLAPAVPTAADQSTPVYETEQIVDALNLVQRDEQTRSLDELRAVDPMSRLQAALERQSPGEQPGRIGETEADVLSVVGRMFASILEDRLLPVPVKRRMARLQTAMQKVAILDEGFFREQGHPARRVLNQLARLEEGFDDEGTWAVVDPVIQNIVTGFDTDVGVFSDAVDELDGLVEKQKAAFQDNVSKVVEACEEQQNFVKSREKDGEARKPRAAAKDLPEEWREWLNRAKRLKVGDVLAMRLSKDEPVRATLAWIGEEFSSYVFVDGRGMKVATLTLQELAMYLRRGTATVIQESDLSVVDRALYSMLHDMHEQIALQATHDQLTGLINRREFEGRLEAALKSAIQDHQKHALCHVDLDNFETLSESHGGDAVDAVLNAVAELLDAQSGDGRTAARLGDHAFGVLLERHSGEDGYRVAELYRRAVQQMDFSWKDKKVPVTASIGFLPITSEAQSVDSLLKAAGIACRAAAKAGGNRIQAARLAGDKAQRRKGVTDWVGQLSETLSEDRVQLRCQRVTPMGGGDGSGPLYEILLGLRDDGGEPIPTGEFLEAAEYYSQMPTLDRWVIRNVFRWMAQSGNRLKEISGCIINMSAHTLSDDKLLEFVVEQLGESRVPPGKVCFEVTETAALTRLSEAEQFIRTMREFGCRFSLDDFGKGESSYSHLKELPVDFVKIDGVFVKAIVNNTEDYAVVKSINEIAHLMGKKTIAEFVETEEILRKLSEVGVDYVQGFWVEEPMYLEELGVKRPVRRGAGTDEPKGQTDPAPAPAPGAPAPAPAPAQGGEEPEDDQESTIQLD